MKESELEQLRHEINAKIDNLSRCPEKPQKHLWYQEGFQDCLDQVMLALGQKNDCRICMDRGYVRDLQFDYLGKCSCKNQPTKEELLELDKTNGF